MKICNITRTEPAARFPQKPVAASELARPAITPSGAGVHSTTTTITTTVTTTATDSTPEYQPTIERFTLRSASADQPISEEEVAAALHLAPAPIEQVPTADPVIDHLLQYFHAVETARLARFLASAKVSRSARADKAVQLAQAYANHE